MGEANGRVWGVLGAVVLAWVFGGCQPIGYIASVVGGPPKVKAAYKLEPRATVVMVDDPADPGRLPSPQLGNLIAGRVGDVLAREKALGREHLVGPEKVSQLAAQHADFAEWPIDRVGRAVGAEQVVYVLITGFTVSEGGAIYEPRAGARVKVIDAASGDRLFPDASMSAGFPVGTEQSMAPMESASATTDLIIARRLAEALGRDVARLFFKHAPEQVGDELPG